MRRSHRETPESATVARLSYNIKRHFGPGRMIRGLFVRKSRTVRHKFFISNVKLWYNDENHFLTKEIIMDKLIDIIKGRKSVRTFDGKGLSDEDLRLCE